MTRETTATTAAEALRWIDTMQHHSGSWLEDPGFMVLAGRKARLRVPHAIWIQLAGMLDPLGRPQALYALTPAGLAFLAANP